MKRQVTARTALSSGPPVPPGAGQAEGHADKEREKDGGEGEGEGVGQRVEQHLGHRLAASKGRPEVAPEDACEPIGVLVEKGSVESELGAPLGKLGLRGGDARRCERPHRRVGG